MLTQVIPKIILQTYKDNIIHEKIYNNINNILYINSDYDYYLITDDIGRSLIKKYFEKKILDAYDKLPISFITVPDILLSTEVVEFVATLTASLIINYL